MLRIPSELMRQIMIYHIANDLTIKNNIHRIGSKQLNDINDTIIIQEPPLFTACKNNDSTLALRLIPNDCEHVNEYGETSLIHACQNKMPEVAIRLLDHNCKPANVDYECKTALIYACENMMHAVALRLLDMDCNFDVVDSDMRTALIYAVCSNLSEIALKILDISLLNHTYVSVGHISRLLQTACLNGMSAVALKLLEYNCSSDRVIGGDDCCLTFACISRMPNVILKMLDCGYNPNIIDEYSGDTPLMYACDGSMFDVAMKLIELNVPLDIVNKKGETALIRACRHNMSSVIIVMLDKNCLPNHRANDGDTAMDIAVKYNMKSVINKLKKYQIE